MRLKQLKIAGFKSFPELTKLDLPGQIEVIVGSNGSGKSNIIDAVRWVLGESSAKNLRGDAMTDVIFNGAASRKPLGQASVELIFDNSLGRIGGAMAAYAELSIKRRITRDGESTYFLNGSRCRKRDITDIFLGTGANARGYSIISQGTISRIIEARPEELRVFLEEAAGVSKYKERRRETMQRIAHSRENLLRVEDIREELGRQIHTLERQAKAAVRYHELKASEGQIRTEITALKWQSLKTARQEKLQALNACLLDIDKTRQQLSAGEKQHAALLAEKQVLEAHYADVQKAHYQLAMDITRLEESLLRQRQEKKQIEEDRSILIKDIAALDGQCQQDQKAADQLQAERSILQEKQAALLAQLDEDHADYEHLQAEAEEKQKALRDLQQELQRYQGQCETLELQSKHLLEQADFYQAKLKDLRAEKTALESQSMAEALGQKQIALEAEEKMAKALLLEEKQLHSKEMALHADILQTEKAINQQFDAYQESKANLSAFLSSQRAARKASTADIPASWENLARLLDRLQVESQWQRACEWVLGDRLHAFVLEDLSWFQNKDGFEAFRPDALVLKEKSAADEKGLAAKFHEVLPSMAFSLTDIHTADTLPEAMAMLPTLKAYESVITQAGDWLGPGWIHPSPLHAEEEEGLLSRQQKIVELEAKLPAQEAALRALRQQRDQQKEAVGQLQEQIRQIRQRLAEANARVQTEKSLLAEGHKKQQAEALRLSALLAEEAQMQAAEADSHQKLATLRKTEERLSADILRLQNKIAEKSDLLDSALLREMRERLDLQKQAVHEGEMALAAFQIKIEQYKNQIERGKERKADLETRLKGLNDRAEALNCPEEKQQEQLADMLSKQVENENKKSAQQAALADLSLKITEISRQMKATEAQLKQQEDNKATLQLEEQSLAVKADALLEAENAQPSAIEQIGKTLSKESTLQAKEQQLLAVVSQIQKLGAINLAAIEAYESSMARKEHIDKQYEDLNEALLRLEEAISRMDQETAERIESSLAEVNQSFQSLFPKIFGGGRAFLQTTSDNMLETGIIVMAQPPGKRNASIQLLSGGEKAMTALALVFAIFQLNPAPFCMLDEVDAPLDDTNISRFCDLLGEMSKYIQFLLISHNKITMEIADHLIGVTMGEPGVSRLVSVDLQQALLME